MTIARALAVAITFAAPLTAAGDDAGASPAEHLAALKAKGVDIYFGHQSVGANIMSGVDHWIRQAGGGPARSGSLGSGVWVDGYVGNNQQPLTKIAAFQANVTASCASLDVALLKFCYVDSDWFGSNRTPAALLAAYKDMVEAVRAACPNLELVHLTMPLQGSGNSSREQYNALLRKEYGSAVFDVALWESTKPDGSRARSGGTPVLYSGYTNDGGHLNAAGSQFVAAKLIAHLAGLEPRAVTAPGSSPAAAR